MQDHFYVYAQPNNTVSCVSINDWNHRQEIVSEIFEGSQMIMNAVGVYKYYVKLIVEDACDVRYSINVILSYSYLDRLKSILRDFHFHWK